MCKCDCGNEKVAQAGALNSGKIKSCGCLAKEQRAQQTISSIKHHMSSTRFYKIFINMHRRCKSPKSANYKNYGARGITVSKEWDNFEMFKDDMFESYKEHVSLHGEKNTTLDRKDTDLGYCKENCRWETLGNQQRNRSNNRVFEVNNERLTLAELARKYEVNYNNLQSRLRRGWTIEESLFK